MPPLLREPKGLERPGEPGFERAESAFGDAMDTRMRPDKDYRTRMLRSVFHDPAALGVDAEDDGFLQFA